MNVVTIGSDRKLLAEGSEVRERISNYGTLVERLDVLLYDGHFFGVSEEIIQISPNTFVHPRSLFGIFCLFRTGKLSFLLNHKVFLISTQDPFWFGFIGWLFSKWLHIPLHVQVHTDFLNPHFARESFANKIKVRVAKRILAKADGIRVVSDCIKESINKKILTKVIPNVLPVWVDVERFKNAQPNGYFKERHQSSNHIFLMASRLTKEKNIPMAIYAMAELVKRHKDALLVILGEGPEEGNLKKLVEKLKLSKYVVFENWTDDLPSFYKSADVFLLTSNYEGYGRTIVEALASGTPVISTRVGCAGNLIRQKENGMTIPVGDVSMLYGAMLRYIEDGNFRNSLLEHMAKNPIKLPTKKEYLAAYKEDWDRVPQK